MGWKNVKEHYAIKHIVQVREGNICIGSGFIPDIIVISPNGSLHPRPGLNNPDLLRYLAEMEADHELLRNLAQSPDTFETSIPVYTYHEGVILETVCEKPGYPNVTHAGEIMYENTYSTDKDQVIKWARRSAESHIHHAEDRIEHLKADLIHEEAELARAKTYQAKLELEYPSKAEASA